MDPQAPQQPTPPPQPYYQPPQAPMTPPQPGPQPQPMYGYPPQPAPYPMTAKTNVFAVLSLVLAFFVPLIGFIFGFVALSQIKRTNEQGKGLAIAGTIISGLSILFFLFFILLAIIGSVAENSSGAINNTPSSSFQAD